MATRLYVNIHYIQAVHIASFMPWVLFTYATWISFLSFSYYLLLRSSIVAQKQNKKERKTRWERLWSLQGLYDTFRGKRTISAPKSVSQNSTHITKKVFLISWIFQLQLKKDRNGGRLWYPPWILNPLVGTLYNLLLQVNLSSQKDTKKYFVVCVASSPFNFQATVKSAIIVQFI